MRNCIMRWSVHWFALDGIKLNFVEAHYRIRIRRGRRDEWNSSISHFNSIKFMNIPFSMQITRNLEIKFCFARRINESSEWPCMVELCAPSTEHWTWLMHFEVKTPAKDAVLQIVNHFQLNSMEIRLKINQWPGVCASFDFLRKKTTTETE